MSPLELPYCVIINEDNGDDLYFVASNGEVIFDIYNQEVASSIPDETTDMTTGERNALSKAQSYLRSSAFFIHQLMNFVPSGD